MTDQLETKFIGTDTPGDEIIDENIGANNEPVLVKNPDFVTSIIEQQLALTHGVTNSLIESLESQVRHQQATINAIREDVMFLLDGVFMPTPRAIEQALFPSEQRLQLATEQHNA